MDLRPVFRVYQSLVFVALVLLAGASPALSRTVKSAAPKGLHKRTHRVVSRASLAARSGRSARLTRTRAGVIHTGTATHLRSVSTRHHHHVPVYFNPWTEPTFADSTIGDNVDGEELIVRKAAVDALGPYNGTVIVEDPQTGRILSMVNQKLAMKGAYQPCSTVKMVISLASLKEGLVNSESRLRISRRYSLDMTRALATSNNLFFARLGEQLGFDRVHKYGQFYGLGEKAGLDIPGEEPGTIADEAPQTGVGMMTSFGDGIRLTPLELTSIVSSIANGGTMYYLQYPKDQDEAHKFVPRIKRDLAISDLIPDVKQGMEGAVEYGTARRAGYSNSEAILGKTGTCTDTAQPGVHLGWFASFNDAPKNKIVVVVLLTGGRGVSGPIASGIAGNVYRNLSAQNYFVPVQPMLQPTALLEAPVPIR
jgi:cell division protein FtsI/penicillin-binding protein 2